MLNLRHVLMAAFALLALVVTGGARAQDEEKDAMRRPERLTVGTDDQFLGQLAPNGKDLYFISNRHTVNEIYVENIDDGRAHVLFDEGAEVTWPRVSPDGKSILYISYSQRATGQLCVRDLPSGQRRRCLGGPQAVLLAEWIDSKRIVAVARATIEGNLRAIEVAAEPHLTPKRILGSNLANPAVSPDGRWLVYVPLERTSARVGPAFRAHAGQRIEAVRIEAPGTPVPISIDVPGLTGQPVFSKDGKWLYFVQFFADSNHDGVVDADDHGVLFRVPLSFGPDGRGALAAGPAVQITDEAWNCQYPAPAKDKLITTCSRGRNLDLYSLPLDGEVPENWPSERLALEIDLSSSHAKLQILYHHRLARAKTLDARRFVMLRLVRLHLTLEEFDAATFYAKRIDSLDDTESDALSQSLLVLIEHRKALRDRERGRMFRDFDEQSRARMNKLPTVAHDSRAAAAMARIVRSEIADTIGDKTLARTELEATTIAAKTPRAVLEAYYERADELYRELDDREALLAACRKLASREKLALDDQLRYARAAVRAMIRGLPFAEADARLARERAATPEDSELGFAIDLARIVLKIRPEHNAAVRKELLDFYEKQNKVERHRAIVLDAVQRAIALGADPIVEALAQEYIDDIKPGTIERRRAERLYMQVMIGRAFRRRAAGRLDEARADFEAVATRTGALEAVVGTIDLRLRAGEKPEAIRAAYTARPDDDDSEMVANFVAAYLLSRQLPKLEGEEHARAEEQAIAALMRSWTDLKNQCIAQSLYGSVLHERYLRTGEPGAAERAGTHYLVALELVGNNLRYRAMVLGQLGLLHTQVGNYRIALGYLKDRDKLPYADNSEGFAVRSAKAQALLHIGREKDAATAAEEALAMLDRQPKLERYRVLALDRAALYNLAADQFERALALYDAEIPIVDKDTGPSAQHNRFVVRLARAAAALGAKQPQRALADLTLVDRALDDKKFAETLEWPHADNDQVIRSYRLIAAGLRGRASHGLGQLAESERALETRRKLLEKETKTDDSGNEVRALMLVESQIADNAIHRGDRAQAAAAMDKALKHADHLHDLAKGAVDADQLHALWLAAEMYAFTGVPAKSDVPKRLDRAMTEMAKQGSPEFRNYMRWFEIYMSLIPRTR
ncbi:hypothetical protein LVJ94_46805 [Pendulispora rubella]|uniref:Uncharacterized protein n=1 Tax=Pendulispora rubella TaxID=2741070 RepID=A0ABZ2L0F8_9BACT